MTAKQAVKARCRDCLSGARECEFADCVLKGLAKAKGRIKTRVIKDYCLWCLNGHNLHKRPKKTKKPLDKRFITGV